MTTGSGGRIGWQAGALGVPGAVGTGVLPSVCSCWPPLLAALRFSVFLSAPFAPRPSVLRAGVFFLLYRQSELIWGTARRRPGSACWRGGGSGQCQPACLCGWSSVMALEAQCYFPRMSLCVAVPQAALWLLWLSRPALLQPVHCSCPELHVRHLGTNRLHSLPQFLVLAAVLAMALEPACSASLHTRERVCARVCECMSACGTLPYFPTYLLTCVLLLFSFLPSPPNFFFLA